MVEHVKWCNCFLCPLRPWVSLPEVSQWSVSPLTNSNPEQYLAAARVVFLHRGGASLVRPVHRPRWGWQYFRDNINSGFPPLSLHSPGCRRNCTRLEGRSGSALLAHAHCVLFTFVHHLSLLELMSAIWGLPPWCLILWLDAYGTLKKPPQKPRDNRVSL